MKKIIFFLVISVPVFGQNVDYNKIILPDYTKTADFGEKLVQLAWKNHPSNETFRREVDIAEVTVRQSSAAWLDIISVAGNMNEFTINPQSDIYGRSAYWPKYNVRASISLGQLFTIPATTRVNRHRLMIAQANVNTQKLTVRNQVLKAYNEYVLREKMYKVQSQLLLDNETSHKLIEQRFKNGETNFETYSLSLSNYTTMTVAQLEAERNYKNAKLDLEQLIGMRLEDVR
ncbi:TolC family protein [Fulvivirgaceae bacterium PWU4]|uniref:TolC family protein n=1 Tax=Chryseosolibacter histidini TaxID=2782349 RepID=A0AAP2DNN6_9BACT|nr:TolC family protein [Chryseosolibacter histidini]MBT1697409.1 TolC family protein [Chryseosolibacter histidini]